MPSFRGKIPGRPDLGDRRLCPLDGRPRVQATSPGPQRRHDAASGREPAAGAAPRRASRREGQVAHGSAAVLLLRCLPDAARLAVGARSEGTGGGRAGAPVLVLHRALRRHLAPRHGRSGMALLRQRQRTDRAADGGCCRRSSGPSAAWSLAVGANRRDVLVGLTAPELLCRPHARRHRHAGGPDHTCHRPPVVVGGPLRGCASRNAFSPRANEIHVPAGEPVRLVLNSTDVIHSSGCRTSPASSISSPAGERVQLRGRRSRGPIAANAPSFAVSSTRIWACSWWPSRGRSSSAWRDRQLAASAPPASTRSAELGSEVFLEPRPA